MSVRMHVRVRVTIIYIIIKQFVELKQLSRQWKRGDRSRSFLLSKQQYITLERRGKIAGFDSGRSLSISHSTFELKEDIMGHYSYR